MRIREENFSRTLIVLALVFAGTCVWLFNSFYQEAKDTAIAKLNEEQMIHARQAAQGIEDFFTTWTRNLSALARTDEIVDNGAVGQRFMKLFYEANQEQVMSITRLDENGTIIYNFPQSSSVGKDISQQQHVRELLRDHRPVISDVFRAIEGFDAVAIYAPVFRGSEFKGGIAVLVNFKTLAHRYLDVVKIGQTGYAWVLSRDGTILYTPVAGFTGKSEFEVTKNAPSLKGMVDQMLQGHEGVAQYTFDRIGDQTVRPTTKYAVYLPVQIGNTFWSIAVATAERDVFSGLVTFRNKLFVVIGVIFIAGLVISTLGAKAWLIVKEEEKRKQAEARFRESEQQLAQQRNEVSHLARVTAVGELSASLAHELSQPLGAILRNAEAAELFLQDPSPDLEELRAIVTDIRKDDQRAGVVISRMRSLVKRREVEVSRFDLNLLAAEVISLVQPDADLRKVQLAIEPDTSLPDILGDRVQLQQVLLNLLLNAMDAVAGAAPDRCQVTIRIQRTGAWVEVAVSDCGHGIPADKLPRIFDPFFTTKRNGLGLGLPISRTIVESHGGRIRAENNAVGGATFSFTLPLKGEQKI